MPSRILVAVDGSVASLQAARLAVGLAALWNARLRAIAVADGERAERLLDESAAAAAPARERRRAQLQDVLEHVRRFGADAGVEVEAGLRDGVGAQPYERILEEADRWGADLLFLGRSGHRGLGRAILGSQVEQVLEFARLPVVVVPESVPHAAGSRPDVE